MRERPALQVIVLVRPLPHSIRTSVCPLHIRVDSHHAIASIAAAVATRLLRLFILYTFLHVLSLLNLMVTCSTSSTAQNPHDIFCVFNRVSASLQASLDDLNFLKFSES
jgi:hypothetical protein